MLTSSLLPEKCFVLGEKYCIKNLNKYFIFTEIYSPPKKAALYLKF